jgi:hypothetical protein
MDKTAEAIRRAEDFDHGRALCERAVLAVLYLDRPARAGRGLTEAQIAAQADLAGDDVRLALDVLAEQAQVEAIGVYWRITARGVLAFRKEAAHG